MIRLFFFLLVIAACAYAVSWLAAFNGTIHMQIADYVVEISLLASVVIVVLIILVLVSLIEMLLWFKAAPRRISRAIQEKKRDKGIKALTEGFAAIAAGDSKKAHDLARRTRRYLGEIPLTTLLAAQTAQLEGNHDKIKQHYNNLLENDETELIALKALLMEAHKDGNDEKALELAKRAVALNPDMHWAVKMLVDLYKQTKQWEQAQMTLEAAVRRRVIRIEEAKRSSAMLYIARSKEAEEQKKRNDALYFAQEAQKQLPYFVPIVVQLATLYHETGRDARALKLLESTWKRSPHPDITALFLEIHHNIDENKLVKKAIKFTSSNPDAMESDLLIAQATIKAKEYAQAQNYLKIALSKGETKAACTLMEKLETLASNDEKTIEKWRERTKQATADPFWGCSNCGHKTEKWHYTCQHCHAFDTLEWRENRAIVVSE